MVKKELIKKVAERTGESQKDVSKFFEVFEGIVLESVANGDNVKLGIGTFKRQETKGRVGVSKLHGEEKAWQTKDGYRPAFKASKSFKDTVDRK